jgi:TrmH family RNA methyltransferase
MGAADEVDGRRADVVGRAASLSADPRIVRLEGLHCVKHALRFGAEVELLVTADREAAIGLAQIVAPDVRSRLVTDLVELEASAIDVLMGRHRFDVVGFARRPASTALPTAAPAVLLEVPRNLGNLGAVVRVAAGFGARAVRTTGSVDPWHPTVVRAAAGLHFAVSVERIDEVNRALAGNGPLLAFDPTGDDLRAVAIPPTAVLAFGSERRGLSPGLRARAERIIAIPMRERVSSYNLATSVAVALFHWSSQTAEPNRDTGSGER